MMVELKRGVNWHKKTRKWEARIQVHKKRKSLGYFKTEHEAQQAYLKALKEEMYGIDDCSRGS